MFEAHTLCVGRVKPSPIKIEKIDGAAKRQKFLGAGTCAFPSVIPPLGFGIRGVFGG